MLGIDGDYTETHATSVNAGGRASGDGGNSALGAGNATAQDAGMDGGASGVGGGGGTTATMDAGAGKSSIGSGGELLPSAGGGAPAAGGHEPSGGSSGMTQGGGGTMGGGGGPMGDGGVASGGAATGGTGGERVCPSGTFTGTYGGTHRPTTGGTVSKAPIAGDLALYMVITGHTSLVTGTLINPINATSGGIGASVHGSIECNTGVGSLTLAMADVTTLVPPIFAPIDGSLDVKVEPASKVDGSFSIHESANILATGSGTWSATRTGP